MNKCETCKCNKVCDHYHFGFENCGNYVPMDCVEVVHCKDCKYYSPDAKHGLLHTPCARVFALCICHEDSFCSYGERKEGAE